MRVVPAERHSAALAAWVNRRRLAISDAAPYREDAFRECADHVSRLRGEQVEMVDAGLYAKHMRLLTTARADAWLREHIASEPTSLLKGVVL